MNTTMTLDAEWKRWVAENALLGRPSDELKMILVENGFSEEHASEEVDAAFDHPYVRAGSSVARQLSKRDWVLHNRRMLLEDAQSQIPEVWDGISAPEFMDRYYFVNRPVVVRGGCKLLGAMEKWTPDYLKQVAGEREVQVQANRDSDPDYEINDRDHRETWKLGDLVEKVFDAGETNDFYMTANNASANGEAIADFWADVSPLPDYLDSQQTSGMFFWMGPAGTVTPLHHDLTNNLMMQIRGRKRVKMISPDYLPYIYNELHCYSSVDPEDVDSDRFPLFENVQVIDVTIGPGDILFLPVGWWHHVRGLDPTITITCTNFRGVNRFTEHYHTYDRI